MKSIIRNRFKKNTVIQIFIKDESIKIKQISNSKIDFETIYTQENINNLYYYLESALGASVQLIYSGDMSFRNINSVRMSQTNIKNMLSANIIENNTYFNTSFFTADFVEKDKISLNICDISFSEFAAGVIDKLIAEGSNLVSIVSFPQWIVLSYFSIFKIDKSKFPIAIFVVKNNESTEIIATSGNEKIMCYRKFIENDLSEKNEVMRTMEYISREKKIALDDISIYHISEETLISFTKLVESEMRFVSTIIAERNIIFEEYGSAIKMVLRALCFSLLVVSGYKTYDIIEFNNKISKAYKIIRSVPACIISEMDCWKSVPDRMIRNINYRAIISDILFQTKNSQIMFLDINTENEIITMKMKMLNSELGNSYSKQIISTNYKFDVSVSDEEITCNGTNC